MWQFLSGKMLAVCFDGAGIYIRPPHPRDIGQWVELRRTSGPFLIPWEPAWPADASTPAAFRRRFRRFREEWRAGCGFAFFIFEQEGDRLVGGITLSNVRRGVAQSGSIGYWIGEPFARKGDMTIAVDLMLTFAFESLGLYRVEAACLPHNAASRGLLQKAGFKEEGLARKFLCINGVWQDHVTHAILRADWSPARRR